jgi:hypothetical protein
VADSKHVRIQEFSEQLIRVFGTERDLGNGKPNDFLDMVMANSISIVVQRLVFCF